MGATSKKKPPTKPRPGKKPTKPAPQAQAKRRKPEMPPSEEPQAVSLYMPTSRTAGRASVPQHKPLTAKVLEELLENDKGLAIKLIAMQQSNLVYEADLAQLLLRNEVRQLVLTQTKEGWEAQVLPVWKGEFLTLVSLKKEKRRYKDLDRLISTFTMHGPLPPTILVGEHK